VEADRWCWQMRRYDLSCWSVVRQRGGFAMQIAKLHLLYITGVRLLRTAWRDKTCKSQSQRHFIDTRPLQLRARAGENQRNFWTCSTDCCTPSSLSLCSIELLQLRGVREQCHLASALNGPCELPLLLGTHEGLLPRHDLSGL
jgi:hypothetical protein